MYRATHISVVDVRQGQTKTATSPAKTYKTIKN